VTEGTQAVLNQAAKILIIDDEPIIRLTLDGLLRQDNVQLLFAETGIKGLALAQQYMPDAILLDLMMPDMDGYEVCRRIRSTAELAEVPVIMITALDNREARLSGLDAGADDFLTKPFDSMEIQIRIKNILRMNRFRHIIDQRDQLSRINSELVCAYDKTIEGWSLALDLRDRETEGHTIRVTETAVILARLAGVKEDEMEHVRRGALLHDIGKLGIPDSILLKPGRLTEEEWQIMRLHPVYAKEWLSEIKYLEPAIDIPYCHHERWNGNGYPRGLKGEKIPLFARIFAIVDVWDALRSERPYRQAMPDDQVREYLAAQKGIDFDPYLVELFLDHIC